MYDKSNISYKYSKGLQISKYFSHSGSITNNLQLIYRRPVDIRRRAAPVPKQTHQPEVVRPGHVRHQW